MVDEFLFARENPPVVSETKLGNNNCVTCPLNVSCFNASENIWHPNVCGPVRKWKQLKVRRKQFFTIPEKYIENKETY